MVEIRENQLFQLTHSHKLSGAAKLRDCIELKRRVDEDSHDINVKVGQLKNGGSLATQQIYQLSTFLKE